MKGAHVRAALICTGLLAGLCEGPGAAVAASPVDDAIGLYRQRRYGEARAALERVMATEPANAAACYYLALALQRVAPPSLDSARRWLAKAVRLAPQDETYLAEYAGVTFLMADRDKSLRLAVEGRDAMAKAVAMNPADLDACDGLMRFCATAPWPLGNTKKALDLAAEIAKRDPRRGPAAYRAIAAVFEKQGRVEQARFANEAAQRLARAGGE